MKHIFITHILLLLFFPHVWKAQAQIKVVNANTSTPTNYKNGSILGTDSIFVIYSPDANGYEIEASMQAYYSPEGINNFTWYRFNATTDLFDSIFTETSVTISNFTTDKQGGYQVRVYNNELTVDTLFHAWLFIELFQIEGILITSSTCETMTLNADTNFNAVFTYYDLVDFTPLVFTNAVQFAWALDPDYTTLTANAKPTFEAPVEPVSFTLTMSDVLKFQRKYLLNIDEETTNKFNDKLLIAVKADFKGQSANETEPADTTVHPEAPHGVVFFNETKNGDEFEWYFYNHPRWMADEGDTLLTTSSLFEPLDSIYYLHPARKEDIKIGYDVALYAWGPVYNEAEDRCLDTLRKPDFVIVDTTQFPNTYTSLPNVFTPNNGDELNNTFYYMKGDAEANLPVKSISYFSIKIYNRWGNKVYDYEDSDGSWTEDGVQGWDGRTRFGGMARPGVYYYVILAEGWDGRSFKVPGYVHVF
jgi:hypothetical protein